SSKRMSSVEVADCNARAIAVPARTRRVVDVPALAMTRTRPAAKIPPPNATRPGAHSGSDSAKAAAAVTAREDPPVTASGTGDAKALRASERSRAAGPPRAERAA